MRRWLWLVVAVLAGLGAVALARSLGLGVPQRVLPRPRDAGETPSESDSGAAPPQSEAAPRRCTAETRSGRRCARDAEPGATTCWQHGSGGTARRG